MPNNEKNSLMEKNTTRRDAYFIPNIKFDNISIIIPVKDNQSGINQFLKAFFEFNQPAQFPKEIIIVDNNSKIPVAIDAAFQDKGISIAVIKCEEAGAAAARNLGIDQASGEWILFTDSDCLPTSTFISGYLNLEAKAIAYGGNVLALNNSWLDKFYNTEGTLLPYIYDNKPLYIVTANALILKEAIIECGYFNTTFKSAGGEDTELCSRLWNIGDIAYNGNSLIIHDFGKGIIRFCKRFYQYGKGEKRIERMRHICGKPKLIKPKSRTLPNYIAMTLFYIFMSLGYYRESLNKQKNR
jgi:glycosyltransferase involved in cell wall biosynthesis